MKKGCFDCVHSEKDSWAEPCATCLLDPNSKPCFYPKERLADYYNNIPYGEKRVIIVRPKIHLKREALSTVRDNIKKQFEEGIVVLPNYMEYEVISGDIEVRFEDGIEDANH